MTDVTNNHVTGLGMPDGTSIASRETKSYDNWAVNAANGVVVHWVAAGLLSVDGYDSEEDPEDDGSSDEPESDEESEDSEFSEEESDDVAAQKVELISQLKDLGVKADKRSSVETLQQKLDEALAK